MCGIVGYVGHRDCLPILIEGIKRLEYRGYDSAGVAVEDGTGLKVVKAAGKIRSLEAKLQTGAPVGTFGIAHTRWATHGEPNDLNAHASGCAVCGNETATAREQLAAGVPIADVRTSIIDQYGPPPSLFSSGASS